MSQPDAAVSTADESKALSKQRSAAPSTASESVLEKDQDAQSSVRGTTSDGETPAAAANARGSGETENEKHAQLERTPTAVSVVGSAVQAAVTREDGSEYPTGVKLGLITLALCLCVFCMALDQSIIATAIPKITDQFQSLGDVGWYGSAYLLTTASLQLLFGKFYTYFSVKWAYIITIGIFELGSLICGVANSSVALIVGRAIAGVGASGIFSGSLIILAYSVPLERRPMYTGFIGSMFGIASVAGPLLGGVFTDKATWRWCFYINLPIGAITMLVIAFFFPPPNRTTHRKNETKWEFFRQFDPLGTAVFMPAVVCLLLALQWGGTTYAWNNGRIIALFVVFGLLIAVFLYAQYRQQDLATVPPRIIRKRSVWASAFFSFCMGAGFMSSVYFLPIWFQAVKGASAVESGIMNLPVLLSVVLLSVIAGILVTVFGYYTPFMIVGPAIGAVGYGLLTTFTPSTPENIWIGYQVLAGCGFGMAMQQSLMAVQTVLDISDVPIGTSVIVFLQTLGGALFVSISENIFTNKLIEYVTEFVPGLDPKVVLSTGATSIQTTIPANMLPGVTLAYNDALTKTFLVSTAMTAFATLGGAFVEWKSVKGKKVEMAVAAA